jgi:hypothetical protein
MSSTLERVARCATCVMPAVLAATFLLAASAQASGGDPRPACTITGTDAADTLRGTPGRDVICGGRGDDTIRGLRGDDTLFGGPGDDALHGGPGDDQLDSGPGDDQVAGGAGNDNDDDDLLQDNPPWGVMIVPTYDLPKGTKLTYTYDPPSGQCISDYRDWTETVGDPTSQVGGRVFVALTALPWQFCAWHRSWGTYIVTAVTPTGQRGSGAIHITTGLPNVVAHTADLVCDQRPTLSCIGGDSTEPDLPGSSVRIKFHLGPIVAAGG